MNADEQRASLAALYALAREACTGASVLDMAPSGEGGAALLSAWGARAVRSAPAPEPSPEPVQDDLFADEPDPGPEFVPAASPGRRLERFSLVLAIGDRPQPRDDRALLCAVRDRLAPGGAAIVRFPVEPGLGREAAANSSALAREILGPPTQILVGMPVTGMVYVDSEVRRLDPEGGLAERQDIYCATRVAGGEGRIERASDIVMAWGLTLPDAAAIAYAPEPAPPPVPPPRRGLIDRLLRRPARPRPEAA